MTTALQDLQDSINGIFGVRRSRRVAKPERRFDTQRKAREQAKAIAALHGIEIEKDGRDFWVTHPDYLDQGNDPLEGNHFATSWAEVLDAVKVYAEAIEAARS